MRIPNIYSVALNHRGEVLITLSNGAVATLSQENAANLAAHIVANLEQDAFSYFTGVLETLELEKAT